MKNKKIILSILMAFSVNVYADISSLESGNPTKSSIKQVSEFEGLSYPQPMVSNNKTPLKLDDLLSSKISSNKDTQKSTVNGMRKDALQEIALSLGASGGLAYRTNQIKTEVNCYSDKLDAIFDFKKLIIDNGVLPPVLTEGLSNYAQNDSDQVRIADKIYKIEEPAKFVSVYPTWRDYLRFSYPTYEMPERSYLPKSAEEKEIWDKAITIGWNNGIKQANELYEKSYAKLNRDYKGMIKYKILLAEGLVTPTIIGKQNLGVTGGGKEMSINDQIFRITDHSALNPNKSSWKVEYPVSNNTNGELK